ncbi:MAG: hypothetical protein ABJE10_04760 [bacterium]
MRTIAHLTVGVAVGLLALTSACASAPSGGAQSPSGTSTASNQNILTASEIQERGLGDQSLYDIIKLIRSSYLSFHGQSGTTANAGMVQVSYGNTLTGIDDLKSAFGREILEVRYLSAASAAQRFGSSSNNGPVIMVKRK